MIFNRGLKMFPTYRRVVSTLLEEGGLYVHWSRPNGYMMDQV